MAKTSKAGAKKVAVTEIAEAFRTSSAAVLTEYRGLTVSEITELRRSLGSEVSYAVVKNTLTKIAAKDAGVDGLDELLEGPTAVAFVSGDPVSAAKSLRDFAKTHPLLVLKGGVMDGRPLTAKEIGKLADLESREVLLGKLAGAMKASLTQAVYLFAAPLSQAARTIAALQPVKAAEPQPAAEAPAAEEVVSEAPAAEQTAEAPAEAAAEAVTEAVTEEAPEAATDSAPDSDSAPQDEAPAEG